MCAPSGGNLGIMPPSATTNYEGMWWAAPAGSESGWGLSVIHQGDTIFATWFTHDATGKSWWLTMTATKGAANSYSGLFYETHGPPFSAVPFDPNAVTRTAVGAGTLTFTGPNSGTFSYAVGGFAQTKAITQQVFGPVRDLHLQGAAGVSRRRRTIRICGGSPAEPSRVGASR